jgi:hypothetical protein
MTITASTLIAANRLVVFLQNHKAYNAILKQYKISHYIDSGGRQGDV